MTDRFEELLAALSNVFETSLHRDRNHACAIQVKKGLIIQLQADETQENLLITSNVVEIPPGKFRENVLQAALKSNGEKDPIIGIFSYIPKTNHLFLFQRYPFDILSGEKLASLLLPFIDKAEEWRDSVTNGRAGPMSAPALFPPGLRP